MVDFSKTVFMSGPDAMYPVDAKPVREVGPIGVFDIGKHERGPLICCYERDGMWMEAGAQDNAFRSLSDDQINLIRTLTGKYYGWTKIKLLDSDELWPANPEPHYRQIGHENLKVFGVAYSYGISRLALCERRDVDWWEVPIDSDVALTLPQTQLDDLRRARAIFEKRQRPAT